AVDVSGAIGESQAPVRMTARVPLAKKGALDVALDAQAVRLAELPRLVLAGRELREGELDLHLRLSGDAAGPRGRIDLALRDARVGALPNLGLELFANVEADSIVVRGDAGQGSERPLHWSGTFGSGLAPLLSGHVPWHAPIRLQAKLDGVDL